MANPLGVPGISVQELAEKLANKDDFIWLDIREEREFGMASVDGVEKVPMSVLARQFDEALPEALRENKEAEVVVMCHHGNRSAQITAWRRGNGYPNVDNLDGGIDADAKEIDESVGLY